MLFTFAKAILIRIHTQFDVFQLIETIQLLLNIDGIKILRALSGYCFNPAESAILCVYKDHEIEKKTHTYKNNLIKIKNIFKNV